VVGWVTPSPVSTTPVGVALTWIVFVEAADSKPDCSAVATVSAVHEGTVSPL